MPLVSRGSRRFAGFLVPKRQRQAARETAVKPALRLSPSELSSAVRVASQGSKRGDLRIWREFAEATLFHMGSLLPKHMAFIANGFARATVPDREVFMRLSDHALGHAPNFEPRDAALFLNAFAKLQFRDLALFKAFSNAICEGPSDGFGEQQLALLCNAYARLGIFDRTLFSILSRWVVQKASELTPQGLATVANAYAKAQLRDLELFAAVGEATNRHLHNLSAQHIANLLNAHAKLELRDEQVLAQLVGQIPKRARDFGTLELSQTLHALTKLELAATHRRALLCLTEAVQERISEFRSRQLAIVLHAFSTLTTSHARLFSNLAPQVLATIDMAGDQSLALMFCAYARASQSPGDVVRALLDKLENSVAAAQPQAQVQLFHACGRLGLHKEPLTRQLADHLRRNVLQLPAQHVSNCLLSLARLSITAEEFASLLAALQARILRRDLAFEPQQLANMLHALAALHGVGDSSEHMPAVLPGTVVPAIVEQIMQQRWEERPQLIASVAVSCARLMHSSAALFSLISRAVRDGDCRQLSKQGLSDLLASFVAVGLFDLDLFSFVLSQLDSGSVSSVPLDCLVKALFALDHANTVICGTSNPQNPEHQFFLPKTRGPEFRAHATTTLFPQCPEAFRLQVLAFYRRLGLALLALSPRLPATVLEEAAPPFARASLLDSMAPWDLLGQQCRTHVNAAAFQSPPMDSFCPDSQTFLSESNQALHDGQETLFERILQELRSLHDMSSASTAQLAYLDEGTRSANLLARYAVMLHDSSSGATISVPASVLDPVLKQLGTVLQSQVDRLSFEEVVSTLEILTDAGVRPRAVLDTLYNASKDKFPTDARASRTLLKSVAALCHSLLTVGEDLATDLRECVRSFLATLSNIEESDWDEMLSPRPLRSVARLLAVADAGEKISKELLLAATREMCSGREHQPEDAHGLLLALLQLKSLTLKTMPRDSMSGLQAQIDEAVALAEGMIVGHLRADDIQSPELALELLKALPESMPRMYSASKLFPVVAECVALNSQALGPTGIASSLHAFARLRVLDVAPVNFAVQGGAVSASSTIRQEDKLPRMLLSILRSLMVLERRLDIPDAVKGAHFCALALDSPRLTEEEQLEVRAGLARLLERLCWQRQRWSLQDQKTLADVATLLRSEYPELLCQGSWVSSSVVSTLSALRNEASDSLKLFGQSL